MIEHPTWPDGDLIQIGHLFQRTGDDVHPVLTVSGIYKSDDRHRISWIDPDLGTTGPSVLTSEITRVLPPRPVAGDMPEHLAHWVESTPLEGRQLADSDGFLSPLRRERLGELLDWAKALVTEVTPPDEVVDVEIVEDDEPRCGATRSERGTDGQVHRWICNREDGHPMDGPAGFSHHDPERGWW
jgi:hypothetical protein